jgi:serine/threonine protein kinase
MRDLSSGDRLDQYELGDLLARSGMASIFKARDTLSGDTVALKIPHVQFESDIVFSQRFSREEAVGLKLDNPSVVKVLKPREKSRTYIAMEYVEGRSLRAIMSAARVLPVDKALDFSRQLCEVAAYFHEQGVVHRDLKPENVLVTADGKIKILDLGIALDESARRLTWAGLSNPLGTPDYMAPEQLSGRRGDARTDVYAIGTMLYEMLTGNLPYESSNPHALMRAKGSEDPRPLTYYVPDIDPALEGVVLRAIARAPRDRYATARQLLADLLDPRAAALRPRETVRTRSWRPRRILMPAVAIAVLAGLGMLIWLSGHRPADRMPAGGAQPAPARQSP